MRHTALYDKVIAALGDLAKEQGFHINVRGDLDETRGVAIDLENDQFIISVTRNYDEEEIWVHCKVRPRPRAHLRTYAVGSLSAYIQGRSDPYPLRNFMADCKDLLQYKDQFLDSSFLNSEELRAWKVDASRRHFGQKNIKRKG